MPPESSTDSRLPILIIGGGFAGLLLAQGLQKHGVPFQVYERDDSREHSLGHRFRVAGDGTEAMHATVSDKLSNLITKTCAERKTVGPHAFNPITFQKVELPHRDQGPGRGPTPVDRTWILSVLSTGIEDKIHRGKELQDLVRTEFGVQAHFKDGTSASGRFLVGADGINSQVRRHIQPTRKLLDLERQVIWGRTWITPEFLSKFPPEGLTWVPAVDPEEKSSVVVYEAMCWQKDPRETLESLPILKDYVYWCLGSVLADSLPRTAEDIKANALEITAGWDSKLKVLFEMADYNLAACKHVYSSKSDIGFWPAFEGVATLIGDAAHPMSPMGGLGGNTAARAAADLCQTIVDQGITQESISNFETRLRDIAQVAIKESFRTGIFMWDGKSEDSYHSID